MAASQEGKMLAGIIVVSVLGVAGFCGAVVSVAGIILNFRKDRAKVCRGGVALIVCAAVLVVTGSVNAVLIAKHLFDNREKIAGAADSATGRVIDKPAEYTARSITETASACGMAYNDKTIKQFENLDIRYLSRTHEVRDGKKIYERVLELNNRVPRNEELCFGNIIANKYLLACDKDDCVYDIVPVDGDAGFTTDRDLISLFEFILNREYAKYGKILPGKTKHTILVLTPEDVDIARLQFLDRRIDL
jgi:hypothetical protein